jgi:hypothetical protein
VLEILAVIEGCLRSWGNSSEDEDIWETLFPDSDDPREEFIYTWDRIKWPRAELDRAQADATVLPLRPRRCYSPGYGQFISIAGHLQKGVSGPILLPCATFSQILHCAPMAVSRYRSWAQRDGLLKLTSRGIRVQRKADEFSFAIGLFDWKTGKQMLNRDSDLQRESSSPRCYTEIQEIERKKETQEMQEKKETREMQREARAPLPEKSKCAIRQGPYIPTAAELAEELRGTAHLRTSQTTT